MSQEYDCQGCGASVDHASTVWVDPSTGEATIEGDPYHVACAPGKRTDLLEDKVLEIEDKARRKHGPITGVTCAIDGCGRTVQVRAVKATKNMDDVTCLRHDPEVLWEKQPPGTWWIMEDCTPEFPDQTIYYVGKDGEIVHGPYSTFRDALDMRDECVTKGA